MTSDWKDIAEPSKPSAVVTAAQVTHGPIIPPQQNLLMYSPDQWEGFVQESLHYCLKNTYKHVELRGFGNTNHRARYISAAHQPKGCSCLA